MQRSATITRRLPSWAILVAANMVPLFGVLFGGWRIFPLVLLYWLENGVIGIFAVLKILLAPARGVARIGKLLFIPFFIVHYGGFMAGHGFFIVALFGGDKPPIGGEIVPDQAFASATDVVTDPGMIAAVLVLFLSHGWSFVSNYFLKNERERLAVKKLPGSPYRRIFVLHVFIIASGFLVASLGSPVAALLLFIAMKTGVDLVAHLREHRKARAQPEAAQG